MTNYVTGAEALTKLLQKAGVTHAFAYPGTSELALCDSILRSNTIKLINGRGDKESAFMAAGASVYSPLKAVAILHGARGSTNALGAIADARKNDVSTLFIVGMPSTTSLPFLPPHGEPELIKGIGHFAKQSFEHLTTTGDMAPSDFLRTVKASIEACFQLPFGPVILGLPQDVAEKAWIPSEMLDGMSITKGGVSVPDQDTVHALIKLIEEAKKPVIFMDDPYLKLPHAKEALFALSDKRAIPILQVRYTRGPMLFERIQDTETPYFAGQYDHTLPAHVRLMEEADLLITLNDRNCYERVVGKLPSCRKIAITTNTAMTFKNGYILKNDLLIEGDVPSILQSVTKGISAFTNEEQKKVCEDARTAATREHVIDEKYSYLRSHMAAELGEIFSSVKSPILVDDSQMLGGVLADNYDEFPTNLRVLGDHGAFVGGGLSFSTGLALCNEENTVFCTLGDQAFVNAVQGLVCARQEHVNIIYFVCNNGKSVSLLKQMKSQDETAFENGSHRFLLNPPIRYRDIAQSLDIKTFQIDLQQASKGELKQLILRALQVQGPKLIEIIAPPDEHAWVGVWVTKGNEQTKK